MCLPAVANRGKTRVHMWSEFGEYIPETEPEGVERLYVWQMAVGLQAVDGLKPSDFLLQTARRNIAGDIGIDEVRRLVYEYYENRELRTEQERTEHEADKVAANMAKIRGDKIVEEARAAADGIIRQAEEDAELERKRVGETIKEQIIDVSTALAEKMLEREVKADDHKALIDDFINKIGENDDSDR